MMKDKRLLPIAVGAIALLIPLAIPAARAFDSRPLGWAQSHRLRHLAWPQSQRAITASMGEPAATTADGYDVYPLYDGRTAYVHYVANRADAMELR